MTMDANMDSPPASSKLVRARRPVRLRFITDATGSTENQWHLPPSSCFDTPGALTGAIDSTENQWHLPHRPRPQTTLWKHFDDKLVAVTNMPEEDRRAIRSQVLASVTDKHKDFITEPCGNPFRMLAKHMRGTVIFDVATATWYLRIAGNWIRLRSAKDVHAIAHSIIAAYVKTFKITDKLNHDAKKLFTGGFGDKKVQAVANDLAFNDDDIGTSVFAKLPGTPFVHKFNNGAFDHEGLPADNPPVVDFCPVDFKDHNDQAQWELDYMRPYMESEAAYHALCLVLGYLASGLCNERFNIVFAGVTRAGKSVLGKMLCLWWHLYAQKLEDKVLVGSTARQISDTTLAAIRGKKLVLVDELDNAKLANGKQRPIQTAFIRTFTDELVDSRGNVIPRSGNLLWCMNIDKEGGLLFNVADGGDADNSAVGRIIYVPFDIPRARNNAFFNAFSLGNAGDPYHQERAVRFLHKCVQLYYQASDGGNVTLDNLAYPEWHERLLQLVDAARPKVESGSKYQKFEPTAEQTEATKSFIAARIEFVSNLPFKDYAHTSEVAVALDDWFLKHQVAIEFSSSNTNHYTFMNQLFAAAGHPLTRHKVKNGWVYVGTKLLPPSAISEDEEAEETPLPTAPERPFRPSAEMIAETTNFIAARVKYALDLASLEEAVPVKDFGSALCDWMAAKGVACDLDPDDYNFCNYVDILAHRAGRSQNVAIRDGVRIFTGISLREPEIPAAEYAKTAAPGTPAQRAESVARSLTLPAPHRGDRLCRNKRQVLWDKVDALSTMTRLEKRARKA